MVVASMDDSGNVIWVRENEILTANVKSVTTQVSDGQTLPLDTKMLGNCDFNPQSLKHNPNGEYVAVCGDGQYIIRTVLDWKKMCSGPSLEFAWSPDGEYAALVIFDQNFTLKENRCLLIDESSLYGGTLLAVCSNDKIQFYDWDGNAFQSFDGKIKNLVWADSGDLVAMYNDSSVSILKYNRDIVSARCSGQKPIGKEKALNVLYEIKASVRTGIWIGDAFFYMNSSFMLDYWVGGKVTTMFRPDRPMYLLRYLGNERRVYLIDKELSVIRYSYKNPVMPGDIERAIEPIKLEIQKILELKPKQVYSVDLHPTEPWIMASLNDGTVCILNYPSLQNLKSFEVTELPVRSVKFIARKQWVVAGADDKFIHVYNYNTMEKIEAFEAHANYISCLVIHPTSPYVLSSSYDSSIKLWDWERDWVCTQTFTGHSCNVTQVTFHPTDTNTFASASLDCTVKIWSLDSPVPVLTLVQTLGVTCVDFIGGDKPYLITGSVDNTAKVWDYETESCVRTLEGHTHTVSAVCCPPELSILITGSDDGTVRTWNAATYSLEDILDYKLQDVFAIACIPEEW